MCMYYQNFAPLLVVYNFYNQLLKKILQRWLNKGNCRNIDRLRAITYALVVVKSFRSGAELTKCRGNLFPFTLMLLALVLTGR